MNARSLLCVLVSLMSCCHVMAAPPARRPAAPKPFPPVGGEIAPAVRDELQAGVDQLGSEIDALRQSLKGKPALLALLPDIQVYHNAVRYPLKYNDLLDIPKARKALTDGLDRARQLRDGKPEWTSKDGPRGYVSRIDGSVQPYTLLMPTDFKPDGKKPHQLYLWCHGRDENLTELNFISGKAGNANNPGPGKFCVILYGRYCNANKFAGEIDCFEAMADVKKRHPIDENRVVLTGFSMGGAAVWHLSVHYADQWAATSPGAGFADTAIYTGLARRPDDLAKVPWWEKKLWHLYDCPNWAVNLSNCPTIAYAGELDKQILSSETMEKAMASEGLRLERLIGPKTEHKYEPATKKELDQRLDAYAAKGRSPMPGRVRFDTWTLRYNKMHWVSIEGLEKHWTRARVDARIENETVIVTTQKVTALQFHGKAEGLVKYNIDGRDTAPPTVFATFVKDSDGWRPGTPPRDLRKRPGLQGPIDDAFLDRFVIVKPTGKPLHEKTGAWASSECDRAIDQWRKIFRGEAQVRADDAVSDAEINDANLVLFGDPSSNKLIAKIVDKLPIRWKGANVTLGDKTYAADQHVPILIYPNPLNPNRYVVLNSGFTFREADHSTNSKQVPRLPDYAIVDVSEPPSPTAPGKVVRAGFFGEKWELLPDDGRGAP